MSLESRLQGKEFISQPQWPSLANRILVVEDDLALQRVLKRLFEVEGFAVEIHFDGRAGLDSFYANPPSATILDLRLPTLSGQHLCQEMKTAAPSIPVVILSASNEISDKVSLLELGADDYVTKPFSPRELMARLRVALRRERPAGASQVVFDDIVVDLEKVQVTRSGISVVLTPHEFNALQLLIQNPGRVITRAELLKQVCGYEDGCTTRTIDHHIMKIRHKLESDPRCPNHFRTVPRLGYKFTF